jgi:hypothetical protein
MEAFAADNKDVRDKYSPCGPAMRQLQLAQAAYGAEHILQQQPFSCDVDGRD